MTSCPARRSTGRHFQPGSGAPWSRSERSARIAPSDDHQDAEDAREVTRPHPGGGAERVVGRDDDRRDAEGDEHQTGDEILRAAHHRHASPPSCAATTPYRLFTRLQAVLRAKLFEVAVEILTLHALLELRLHFVEARDLRVADVRDLDHVPAELRLHRRAR